MALIVKSSKNDAPGRLKVATFGATKCGKTRMAGTFPNPFFFSFGVESGIASLTSMPTESHYVSINNTQETAEALKLFVASYKKEGYKTAVVDTVTLLGRMVQMELTSHGERQMEFKDWSKFLSYFLNIRDTLHACDVHVVWVFHVDDVTSGDVIIGRRPKLAGASLKEILQTVGIICYQDKIEIDAKFNEKGEVTSPRRTAYRLFTRCPEMERPKFEVGSWYDDVLTDPVYYPSFEALAKHLAPRDKDGKFIGQQHITI